MKSERLLTAIGGIADDLIEAAQPPAAGRRRRGLAWAAAAACLAAVLLAGAAAGRLLPAAGTAELPVLDIAQETGANGFGFEGYMAFDISQLASANPWTEQDRLKTLPVYRNPVDYDRAGAPRAPVSEELLAAMRSRLLEAAQRLGLETVQVRDNAPSQEEIDAVKEKFAGLGVEIPEGYFAPTEVTAEGGGVELTVGADLAVRISFDPAVSLPEGYRFSSFGSYADAQAVGEYLLEQYRDLLDMEKPQVNVTGGDFTYSGKQMHSVGAFSAAGNKTRQIVNYNFNSAQFFCNEEGGLWLIRLDRPDLSQKVGDYPLISVEEARELLYAGNYISTVSADLPGEEYVARTELVYRTGRFDRYFMPYYRFYVELPDMAQENGLKTFGAYYVPAVSGEYLTGIPLWEGQFN